MNKCRYCKEQFKKCETGWIVCKCEKAQKEWEISIKLQHYKKMVQELSKELSELKDSPTKKKKSSRWGMGYATRDGKDSQTKEKSQ